MAGDMPTAIARAGRLRRIVNPEVAAQLGWLQPVDAAPYLAYAQFASPEEILALGEADARLPYVVAMRHYARARGARRSSTTGPSSTASSPRSARSATATAPGR